VLALRVPPLRERLEDLPELAAALWREMRGNPPFLEKGALEWLRRHPWPGNVRELRNVLARLQVESPERVGRQEVERVFQDPDPSFFPGHLLRGDGLDELKDRLERDYIVHHFRQLLGSTQRLCRFLRLGRRQLFRRCERLGISLKEERRKLEPT
jgi:two-component system nitrogen regulation response regulator NtrX